jgi:hypothetical protein
MKQLNGAPLLKTNALGKLNKAVTEQGCQPTRFEEK